MPYASRTDFDAYGLPTATLDAIASSAVQDALLLAASAEVDGYLRAAKVALPLTTWDARLTEVVCLLAVDKLIARRGYNPDNRWEVTLEKRVALAVAWLRDVTAAHVTPDYTDATPAVDEPSTTSCVTNPRRRWSR